MKCRSCLLFIFVGVFLLGCDSDKDENLEGYNDDPNSVEQAEVDHTDLSLHVSMPNKVSLLPPTNTLDELLELNRDKSSRSNVIVFFVDTLRYDYIDQYAPNVKQFLEDNISAKHIASATATQHSTFAFYHSQPSFLAYHAYLNLENNENDKGSLFLQLLKNNGYDIYAIGSDLRYATKKAKPGSYESVLQSFFGHKMYLLNNHDKKIRFYPETINHKKTKGPYTDHLVFNEFKRIYDQRKHQGKTGDAFFWLAYDNVHDPFAWGKSVSLPYPDLKFVNGLHKFKLIEHFSAERIRMAYANAVASMDVQFKRLINFLIDEGIYDDYTLLLVSDHGEILGEKGRSVNSKAWDKQEKNGFLYLHGTSLYREQIETPFAVKFAKKRHERIDKARIQKTLYGIDLFPTLFDGLGIDLMPFNQFLRGQSILSPSESKRSTVVVMPNGVDPTNKLALINDDYKVQIQINDPDFYHASSFKIVTITDLNDQPVFLSPPFDIFGIDAETNTVSDKEGLIEKIKADFKEALSALFGGDPVVY